MIERREEEMELTIWLGVTAALLHGTAFVLYNVQTFRGESTPNFASWGVWAILATLNALTFRAMENDTVATLQFVAGSIGCIATFLYALAIGKFAWPDKQEQWLFVLSLIAVVVWLVFNAATSANMIVLTAAVISFIPTARVVWKDPFKETPRSWVIWTLACAITVVNVLLRQGWSMSLVTPAALLVLHGSIAVLCGEGRKLRVLGVNAVLSYRNK